MIIPVVNMDATPLIQFLVFIAYIGLVYGLFVEIIGYHPFRIMKKAAGVETLTAMESETTQEKASSDEGRFQF